MDDFQRQLPKSALAFYTKIYCKKRETIKSKNDRVLVEATKSWLSLSKNEKQQFISKYEEYKKHYRKAIAEQLKKAEPYLLKKNSKENKSGNSALNDSDANVNQEEATTSKLDQLQTTALNDINSNISQLPLNDTMESTLLCPTDCHGSKDMQDHEVQVLEPAPPKLLSGRDLFNMIHENDNNLWKKLPRIEKGRYHSAVLRIKRNYLKDYKSFLEQLPSEKLFNYHKNIIKHNDTFF